MLNKKRIAKVMACIMVAAVAISLFAVNGIDARAEVIYDEKNPGFEYLVNYAGDSMNDGDYWIPDGDLSYDSESEIYTMTSNAYVMWGRQDNVTYAYNKYNLEYGDRSNITIAATILSHGMLDPNDTMHENASIGICLRSTAEVNGDYDSTMQSQCIYLHVRRDEIMVMHRAADGGEYVYKAETIGQYPIKLILEKKGNAVKAKAECGDGSSITFGTFYMNMTDIVTAGIAAHSVEEDEILKSTFTDFELEIEGPEGSEYTPPGGGSSDDGSGEEVDYDNVLPEDPALTEGILFRETFTDGSLINADASGVAKADNPVWTNTYSINGDIENANIVTDTEQENRYWHRNYSVDSYIFPNLEWSDYEMSVDMKFGPDTEADGDNTVNFYVRVNAARASGYFGYRVSLTKGSSVNIYKICGTDKLNDTQWKCASAEYSYMSDEWCTWRVEAFDNRISVYCEEELVLEFVEQQGEELGTYAVNGRGGIGFGSEGADLMVDNIVVRELEDLLGEDYDNKIAGNWEQPVPDYIKNYKFKVE